MRAFLSYAKVDKPIVEEFLVKPLVFAGITAWFDHFLPIGCEWKDVLYQSISACDVFIYASSPESVNSKWCQWEYHIAMGLNKHIVPVILQQNIIVPSILSKLNAIQWSDFTNGPTSEAISRFVGGLYNLSLSNIDYDKIELDVSLLESQLDGFPPQASNHPLNEITPRIVDIGGLQQHEATIRENTQKLREILYHWVDVLGDLTFQIPATATYEISPWYVFENKLVVKSCPNPQVAVDQAKRCILESLLRYFVDIDDVLFSAE